jgi:phosphatidylserine/phosphatidylglycerophosphate/cardiolipin synthase-like enzyme
LNFTRKCFERTSDALVLTHDPAVVVGLRRLLAADRERQPLPEVPERLVVGPERARRQLTSLIEGAKSSIRLIDAKLSDPELVALLNARRSAGITVETFGAKRLGDLKSHGKLLLIDDRVAVVGSLALAAISLDFRREVAIVVEEPDAVAEVSRLIQSFRDAGEGAVGSANAAELPA